MSDKEIFMYVKELGNLYLYDVLLEFIYPRVFVCEDSFNSKFLFYEMSSNHDKDVWLVSRISKLEYYDLIDRKKSIQKTYDGKAGFNLFSITKNYKTDGDEIELSLNAKEWIKMLPSEPVFSEKEIVDDINDETLQFARENNVTTVAIRLFAGSDRHHISCNFINDVSSAFTSLTNSVSGIKRKQPLEVFMKAGSCIVNLFFPDQINLFNESDAIYEMGIVNEVLESKNLSEGLSKVKDQKKFIESYKKMLDAIRKTGSCVQFTTASPNSTKTKKIELSKEEVLRRYDYIKDINHIEKETLQVKGKLIAMDVKTKRFKLLLDDGSIKAGEVGNELLESTSFELPNSYDAKIDVEKYIDIKQNCTKEKVVLKTLVKSFC